MLVANGIPRKKWQVETREDRRELCQAFCEHLATGYTPDSFPDASPTALAHYISKYPEDFPEEALGRAMRQCRLIWETIGIEGIKGNLPHFQGSAWGFVMKNLFRWSDRIEVTEKRQGLLAIADDRGDEDKDRMARIAVILDRAKARREIEGEVEGEDN